MVFLTGIIVAMLMLYGNKDFLIHSICIALIAELVNVSVMNKLVKSKEGRLVTRHTQTSDKLKRMLYSSQEREEELAKVEFKQREEIVVLKRALKDQTDRLEVSRKTAVELKEQVKRYQKNASGAEQPAPPGPRKTKPLSLFD